MFKSIFVKNVALDSVEKNGETKAEFFDDKEWKIIVNCGIDSSLRGGLSEAKTTKQSKKIVKSNIDSQITITFFALENDIDLLVRGYLATFLGIDSCVNLANLKRENNNIFVDSHLSKDEILSRLSQKDIIQSCEQIELNDKKINRDSIIMPFNGSRAKISREILEANRDFFANFNADLGKFLVRIVRGESNKTNESCESCAESFDTNPKNAIYKAIGKALDLPSPTESSLRGESQIRKSNPNDLLDATIFLNFRLDIETLKILILQKCTFIVCAEKPAFSVVRFAQKFGITLIAFSQNSFLILTHSMRFLG